MPIPSEALHGHQTGRIWAIEFQSNLYAQALVKLYKIRMDLDNISKIFDSTNHFLN